MKVFDPGKKSDFRVGYRIEREDHTNLSYTTGTEG